MSIGQDFLGGKFSVEELEKVYAMNRREPGTQKPSEAFYKKSMEENSPTWKEKREFVDFLINESNISPISKTYL